MPLTGLIFGVHSCFSLKPCFFMKSSRVFLPDFEQMPDIMGNFLSFSNSPPRSLSVRPRPDPSWPSFMVSSARMFSMGEKYLFDVIAASLHIFLLSSHSLIQLKKAPLPLE